MIELITVMLLIGILAVVALPKFDLLKGFDEIGYTDQTRATLQFARKSAVARRRNVRIDLASTGITVTVERATPEGTGSPGTYDPLPLPGSTTNTIAKPSGVTLPVATTTLTFNAAGSTADATYTIGPTIITVIGATGHVY
jgi:MSHA pilin protein MshC